MVAENRAASRSPDNLPMDLDERVTKFYLMKLPGQPMMHMGTCHLVHDLHSEVKKLRAQRRQLREAIESLTCDGAWIGGEWVPSAEAEFKAESALRDTEEK